MLEPLLAHEAVRRLTCCEAAFLDAGSKHSCEFKNAMPRGAHRVGAGAVKKTGQKKVSAKTLKVYKFAAAAADKKVAAAELAFDSDPSEENKAAVQQARAKACAASAKLGRSAGAALAAEEGGKGKASIASEAEVEVEAEGEVKDWSQQKRARQSRTNGSAVWSMGVTARNARARSAERAAERAARRQRSGACCAVHRDNGTGRAARRAQTEERSNDASRASGSSVLHTL